MKFRLVSRATQAVAMGLAWTSAAAMVFLLAYHMGYDAAQKTYRPLIASQDALTERALKAAEAAVRVGRECADHLNGARKQP